METMHRYCVGIGMKTIAKLLFLFILFFTSFNCSNNSSRQKSSEELKQELKIQEQSNPSAVLDIKYSLDYKILAGADIIKGVIINSATVAKFKDVVLTVTYSTATDTELKSEDFTIYKLFGPGSSTNFELKVRSPKYTKKIGVTVNSAIPVN